MQNLNDTEKQILIDAIDAYIKDTEKSNKTLNIRYDIELTRLKLILNFHPETVCEYNDALADLKMKYCDLSGIPGVHM